MQTKMDAEPRRLSGDESRRGAVRDGHSPRGPKVLLTSICRPIGPAHGAGDSVGYEVLHGQITRA